MKPVIKLANDLVLPVDAVTQTFADLGMRGSGKTTTASVFAEQLLSAQLPLVILDPTDAWWGLRSSKDGKSDGFPITILGGDHADAPLEETAGRVIADLVAESAPPLVLSLRALSISAQKRFVADFAERLYEKNRNALHVFIDEADEFVPQRVPSGGERLFGAIDRIVRRGRSSGIGVTMITQRSAVISKDVLSQCETLIAHRASHPLDQAAVIDWMKVHGTPDQIAQVKESLAKLANGEAWVMSPQWLNIFARVRMHDRTTFNSSATPKAGERLIAPKRLAPVDLKALQVRMADTFERAKTNDPVLLRRRITDLEAELRKKPVATAATVEVKVPLLDADQLERFGKALDKLDRIRDATAQAQQVVVGTGDNLRTMYEQAKASLTAKSEIPSRIPLMLPKLRLPPAEDVQSPRPLREPSSRLGRGHHAILTALFEFHSRGLTRDELATRAVFVQSGTFSNYLSELRTRGLITAHPNRKLLITAEGRGEIGVTHGIEPRSASAVASEWGEKLGGGPQRILQFLKNLHPDGCERGSLAAAVGLVESGTYSNYLSELRTRGLLVQRDGLIYAGDALFLSEQ